MSCEIFIMSRRQSSTNSVILDHNIDLDETEFVQNQITNFCIKNRNIKGNAADDEKPISHTQQTKLPTVIKVDACHNKK